MIQKKRLSVVVPCYNESLNLETFYKETSAVTAAFAGRYETEFVFVDDGSADDTAAKLREMADAHVDVQYLLLSRNFGKEAAMYAGLKAANGDLAVIMDCDLQDPPALIPEMLKYIEEGYDTVATRRISRKGESPVRSAFSRAFYKIINSMAEVEIPSGTRDYRIMTRSMVDSVLEVSEYHRFSKGIFAWMGYKCKWLEYENAPRAQGGSKWSMWELFKYAVEGIVSFSTVPLRISSFFGFFISLFAVVYLPYIMIRTAIYSVDVPGYAPLLTVSLFIGGMMLFSIGILGEYMARTYMEAKRRPIFLVKEKSIDR